MEYVYHKKEDGSIGGAYPVNHYASENNDKIVGGAAVAHLGVPIGLVIIEDYCQPRPYIEEDSEKPLDFERFDELITNIAKIEGSKYASDDKKTRKRRKDKK
jgi:hypothetical protein